MVNDVMREVMKAKGYTHALLAEKLGYTTQSGVTNKLHRKGSIQVDTLLKFMEAMDCEVVIRSKTTDKTEWVLK
jgi:transcriptional regulator with XRE-family HTH domain